MGASDLPDETAGETYEVYPGWPTFKKGTVAEFKDVTEEEKKKVIKHPLYNEIQRLIIDWSNDNTKTAGRLTRRICKILKNE